MYCKVMKSYLTVSEIAANLKVKPITVRRWISAGILLAYKLGKEYRIDEADFEVFLAKRKTDVKGGKK